MSRPFVGIDTSEILEGKLPEPEEAIHGLATNEPWPISYDVYVNEKGMRMTVVQVHSGSASMELHTDVAGPAFATFEER